MRGTYDQSKSAPLKAWAILIRWARLLGEFCGPEMRGRLILAVLVVAGSAAFSTAMPVIFRFIVDELARAQSTQLVSEPLLLIVAYPLSQLLARCLMEARWLIYGRIEQPLQRLLALKFFDHVHGLSLRFHLDCRTGGLQQIIGNGLDGYRSVLFNLLFILLPLSVDFLFVVGVLASLYGTIFLGVIVIIVVYFVVCFVIGVDRQQHKQRESIGAYIDAFSVAADSFLNYETIKYFNAEGVVRADFDQALRRATDSGVHYYVLRGQTGLAQAIGLAAGLGIAVAFAAFGVATHTMTLGDFVLVNTYMIQLWRPLDTLNMAYREIRTGLIYLENLSRLLTEENEVIDRPDARPLENVAGEIAFTGVSFGYENGHPVLRDVSFCIPAGRTTALVGPSGSGKSTVVRLLLRFYDVDQGVITIDGTPIGAFTQDSLRRTIAVVPQDIPLFNDTLGRNVGIGAPKGTSPSAIEAAARVAQLDRVARQSPAGFETVVGERGLKLSGGERQRVGIARAFLKQSHIRVFDEATSAIDPITEKRIMEAFICKAGRATTLVLAHRLSTVVDADEILVMDRGRIVERGCHESLLAKGGLYARLWHRESAESESGNGERLS